MLTILLVGICALLVNIFFYFRELKGIWIGIRKKDVAQTRDEGLRFIQDICVTGLVVLLAGSGLYAFLIGSVGGAIVSLFLWRKELWEKVTRAAIPAYRPLQVEQSAA